jgi:hypothetical protein
MLLKKRGFNTHQVTRRATSARPYVGGAGAAAVADTAEDEKGERATGGS